MAEKKEDKFIVINKKHLQRLSTHSRDLLHEILSEIENQNKYIVCNQDEPYADMVWKIIIMGEDVKTYELKQK